MRINLVVGEKWEDQEEVGWILDNVRERRASR